MKIFQQKNIIVLIFNQNFFLTNFYLLFICRIESVIETARQMKKAYGFAIGEQPTGTAPVRAIAQVIMLFSI